MAHMPWHCLQVRKYRLYSMAAMAVHHFRTALVSAYGWQLAAWLLRCIAALCEDEHGMHI